MPFTGTLRTWHDDRGFGFIAPTHGGAEVFVHISAFPRDGSRPAQGESLTYELGRGRDGRPQATSVWRKAIGKERPVRLVASTPRRSNNLAARVIAIALLAALGFYGFNKYQKRVGELGTVSDTPAVLAQPLTSPSVPSSSFSCDGRIYCSQMTSCAEAKFFLKNCPGTKMDGNNDGVPCEQQWCTGPFAK